MSARRRGFTLVEVLVALAIGSMVVLVAHGVFTSVADAAQRLETRQAAFAHEQLATRWLSAAFLSLEAGGTAGSFEGHPSRMRFATWLRQPGGWLEPATVVLEVRDSVLMDANGSIPLYRQVDKVEFDYLLEPGAQSHWVQDWVSPVSAPLAVRFRIERSSRIDTLLFLIKARG